MAVVTTQALTDALKTFIGENNSDEALAFMENFTDTLNDLTAKGKDTTDWKAKYEENDKAWRKRYSDRFWGTGDEDKNLPDDMQKPISPAPETKAPEAEPEPESDTFDSIFTDAVSPAGPATV